MHGRGSLVQGLAIRDWVSTLRCRIIPLMETSKGHLSMQGQASLASGLPTPRARQLPPISASPSCLLLLLLLLLLLPSRLLLPAHFQVASHRPPTILPSLLPVGLLPITGQFH